MSGGARPWAKAAGAVAIGLLALAPRARAVETSPGGLDRYRAWRDRPLFSPTRRPPPPAEQPADAASAPPSAAAPPAPDITVSGIILGLQTRIAIVRLGGSPTATHVTVGGSVGGWTVSAIGARDVTLRRDQDSLSIRLPAHGAPAP